MALPGDILLLEAHEHYRKGSYRNRCHVAGANGIHRLSIPLRKGKNQQMPIREVQLARDTPWPRTHWRTLVSAYGNSPFFPHYADTLLPLFESDVSTLWAWNEQFLYWILEQVHLPGKLQFTERYVPQLPPEVCDWRDVIRPGIDQIPPGIKLVPYGQVFADRYGFLAGLSILDALFCLGPATIGLLRNMRKE